MPKYILKEMPDMQGDGKRKIYPKLDAFRLLDTEDFVKEIHNYHHVYSTSLIESVLMDVADVLRRKLTDGYTVKIDDIGTFSLSLMFNDKKPDELVREDDRMMRRGVEVSNVNFKVDPKLLRRLKRETHLEREVPGVKKITKCEYTREQRIERALGVIKRHGFITLTDYASINTLSRTYASQDLKEISSDPTSPITSAGRGSHKVWVRRLS